MANRIEQQKSQQPVQAPKTYNPNKPFHGETVLFEWKAPEMRNFKQLAGLRRGLVILFGFLALYGLFESNFLFALVMVVGVAVVVILTQAGARQKVHAFAMTDSGLWIDKELHPFINMKFFSVVPYATKKDRFFVFRFTKGGDLRVPIPIESAEKIRLAVNQYVPQSPHDPSFLEGFERMFW
jgi:hypothetical protein